MKAKRSPVLYLLLGAAACGGSDLEQTRADVAEAGSTVMPFDLERTTHIFEGLEHGGLQTVLSDDGDAQQVLSLIIFTMQTVALGTYSNQLEQTLKLSLMMVGTLEQTQHSHLIKTQTSYQQQLLRQLL